MISYCVCGTGSADKKASIRVFKTVDFPEMTKSLDDGKGKDDPVVFYTEDEREVRFRKSTVPFLYGLAGANFITQMIWNT